MRQFVRPGLGMFIGALTAMLVTAAGAQAAAGDPQIHVTGFDIDLSATVIPPDDVFVALTATEDTLSDATYFDEAVPASLPDGLAISDASLSLNLDGFVAQLIQPGLAYATTTMPGSLELFSGGVSVLTVQLDQAQIWVVMTDPVDSGASLLGVAQGQIVAAAGQFASFVGNGSTFNFTGWASGGVTSEFEPTSLRTVGTIALNVPEPATAGVLAMGGLVLLARRRR